MNVNGYKWLEIREVNLTSLNGYKLLKMARNDLPEPKMTGNCDENDDGDNSYENDDVGEQSNFLLLG